MKSPIGVRLVYLHLTLAHSKLKVKVKVKHISTVNISQTVTDRTNIVIANTQDVANWLSIGVFKSDLGYSLIKGKACVIRNSIATN